METIKEEEMLFGGGMVEELGREGKVLCFGIGNGREATNNEIWSKPGVEGG